MLSRTANGLLAIAFFGAAGAVPYFNSVETAHGTPLFKFNIPEKMTPEQMEGMVGAVTEIARETYIDPARSGNNEELTATALKAIISSLDPHSDYLTPKDLEKMRSDSAGKFGGIGIEVALDQDKNIVIINPTEGSPSQKAGLKANDVIIKINDETVTGAKFNEIASKIRGEEGTSVMLTVKRPGIDQPLSFNIVRAIIKTSDIKTAAIGNDIAYIRLKSFMQDNLTAEFEKAVSGINARMGKNLASYVIDLRHNPGGRLDDAVNIAADLLNTDKTIVSTRGKNPDNNKDYSGIEGGHTIVNLTQGKPIVVLVDEFSASASEVLSGALQDLAPDRVTIIGKTTFGKGLVQSIIPLRSPRLSEIFAKHGILPPSIPNGAIKLTTAHYFTPSGRSIHNVGVKPDIQFMPNVTRKGDEPQIPRISEATLPSGLSRPGDAMADETKTTQSCTPQLDVRVRDGYDKILKDRDGNVFPEILCAIDKLRGTKQWTNIAPYTPPAMNIAPAPAS